MYKVHRKFGNFFIVENSTTIAMCTKITIANLIRAALESAELAATDSQPQGKMPLDQQACIHIEVCNLRSRSPVWCPWPCGYYRPMR
jgi:hypothetical protein